jgi:hypothetical protein
LAKLDPGEWEVNVDAFQFIGSNSRKRRPDIYIVYRGSPLALIEIKVEDQDEDDDDRQLADYIRYCRKFKIAFFYLTKYTIGLKEKRLLNRLGKKAFHRRHSEIRHSLAARSQNEIAAMLSTYLEDKGMHSYKPLRKDTNLRDFARRFLPVDSSPNNS